MNRYAGKDTEVPISSSFMNRYAQVVADRKSLEQSGTDADFNDGYKKGNLRYAVASSRLTLKTCGLNHFIEVHNDTIWKLDGDNIIRVESNLDWVDEFLKEESK